jgi:hypothetical protein
VCGIGFDTSYDLKYGFDEATLKECPVCRRIKDVGMLVAGKRLLKAYGLDVLEVIEGNVLPPAVVVEAPKPKVKVDSIDERFEKSFGELAKHMKS